MRSRLSALFVLLSAKLVKVYADDGISATSTKGREQFNTMIEDCKQGLIDYVLTKSISRFSRNTTDCLSLVRELLSYNIPIYFEKENLDTSNMESELLLSILSSMAQDESESISKNVKWSITQRIETGTFEFGYVPYGYKKATDGCMVIDPEEADVVRLIFASALNGMGTCSIAKMLEKRKISTRKGGKWSGSTVKGMLTNKKYYGAAIFQKTYTDSNFRRHHNHGEADSYFAERHHEAIVSKEDFDKAQLMLQMHSEERNIAKNSGKYHNKYPFSGIMICGECGNKFKRQTQSSCIAWACKTHLNDKDACSMMFIKDEAIKAAFVTMLNKLIFAYKRVLLPYYETLKNSDNSGNYQSVPELKSKIQRNAERKNELKKLRVGGFLDSAMYTRELRQIERQNEEYRAELKNLEKSL